MNAIVDTDHLFAPAGSTFRTEQAALDTFAGKRKGLRACMPFVGPAVIASVAYMDPGNFATNIQAGSAYGYALLWVVFAASLVAMLFQAMSAKVGIVTGSNLAQLCRQEFPPRVVMGMWIASEFAAIATDLAEFLGGALGLSLMLHLSMLVAMCLTALATFAILSLDKGGYRPLEVAITALVGVIAASYFIELVILPPDWHAVIFHTFTPQLPDHAAVLISVGIVGATIMPHTLYLHSGLTQNRTVVRNDHDRRRLVAFSNREVIVALGVAGAVNLAMVIMSANVFHLSAPGTADIGSAFHALTAALGVGAATIFLVSLVSSGISSSAVGTMAGQVIMQGFLRCQIPVWLRRVVTMLPAFVAALYFDPMKAMLTSQVVLSFVLPLPLIALVVLSSRESVMGKFRSSRAMVVLASAATALITLLNGVLVVELMG